MKETVRIHAFWVEEKLLLRSVVLHTTPLQASLEK